MTTLRRSFSVITSSGVLRNLSTACGCQADVGTTMGLQKLTFKGMSTTSTN